MSTDRKSVANRIDFEAMRKACEPDEGNERELASWNSPMKVRHAAQILHRGMVLFDRDEVTDNYLCKETISWRLEREGWTAVRWVTVTEYAPGLLRLRNDVLANIPRRIWPFPFPRPCRRPFELTLHWTEFTHDLGGEVYEFCNAAAEPDFHHEWGRFEGEETYPQYAWSTTVTRAAQLIQPVQGNCPTIEHLILGLLDDEEHDQISYLLGWLKVGYEALLSGQLRPGQAMAIAGPRDCGKSLLQHLITEILGGRAAKPYRYMSGATEFNGDLFGAEHLMIEDEVAFTDIRARRHFGARIKDFTVNTVQSCHGKNRPAMSLKPFWRVTITLNDEPENLLILPPIDDSLEDKLMLLKASKAALPADIGTAEGRQRYWAQLMQELPIFLNLLVNFRISSALRSGRFGVKHFHHPELIAALTEMSPEMRLMGLIDAALEEQKHVGQWSGTATELEQMLSATKVGFEARRLLDWNNATGTYLGRLAKKLPHRVQAQRTNAARRWTIVPARWIMPDTPVSKPEPELL